MNKNKSKLYKNCFLLAFACLLFIPSTVYALPNKLRVKQFDHTKADINFWNDWQKHDAPIGVFDLGDSEVIYMVDGGDYDGNYLYCLHPGKKIDQDKIVQLKRDANISACNSSTESYDCLLAGVIQEGMMKYWNENEVGNSYSILNTALRFVSSRFSGDMGGNDEYANSNRNWWTTTVVSSKLVRANAYYKTSQKILNENYSGVSYTKEPFVIYGGDVLKDAINLFNSVVNGIEIWKPKITAIVSSKQNGSNLEVVLKTNFTEGASVSNISVGDNSVAEVTTFSLNNCADGDGKCLTLNINLKVEPDATQIKKSFDLTINFDQPGSVDKIGYYLPKRGTAAQDMIFYESNKSLDSKFTYKLELQNKFCSKEKENGVDVCYGKFGERLDDCDRSYVEACDCFKSDDKCYDYSRKEINCSDYPEICDKPKICVKEGDTYYGKEPGVPISRRQFEEECGCRQEDGKFYGPNNEDLSDGRTYEQALRNYADVCGCYVDEHNRCYIGPEEISLDEDECEPYRGVCPTDPPGTCDDPGITYNMNMECVDDDTITETKGSYMEDPSLCTLLNTNNETKNKYKGIDLEDPRNQYCEVICRERLDFTFMGIVTTKAGRFFQHDVKASHVKNIPNLSTAILGTRQCVNVIKYDSWEEDYKDANKEVLDAWNALKRWEALYNFNGDGKPTLSSGGGSNCKCGGSSASEYRAKWGNVTYTYTNDDGTTKEETVSEEKTGSSAGCGTYSEDEGACQSYGGNATNVSAEDKKYVEKNYNEKLAEYEAALKKRDTLLFKLRDCNYINYDENRSTYMSTVKINGNWERKYSGEVNYKSKIYNNVVSYKLDNYVTFDYDENRTDLGILYELEEEASSTISNVENISVGYGESKNWYDYCDECSDDISGFRDDLDPKPIEFWFCSGYGKDAKCVDIPINVPKNRMATIQVERETVHYQGMEYKTKLLTGEVQTYRNTLGNGWIKLDSKSFPVALDREENPEGYNFYVSFKHLGDTGHRSPLAQFKDSSSFGNGSFICKYKVLNSFEFPPCPPDGPIDIPGGKSYGLYFRTIDLSDVFPNSQYSDPPKSSREIGFNWKTTNAQQVIEEIQSLNNNIWTEKDPMYKVVLTPQARKEIQNYNKGKIGSGGYLDFSLECDDLSCRSNFLKNVTGSNGLRDILGDKFNDYYKKNTENISDLHYYNR